jgi:hypothetical protein
MALSSTSKALQQLRTANRILQNAMMIMARADFAGKKQHVRTYGLSLARDRRFPLSHLSRDKPLMIGVRQSGSGLQPH